MGASSQPLPGRMSALRFTRFGPPAEALTLAEVPLPALATSESLVQVHAVGVNPSDVAMVAGRFGSALPGTPGRDFAGVVVSGPRTGEAVWGTAPGFGITRPGADAEYVAIPDAWLARKPDRLSMTDAAAVTLPYCTAWWAVIRTAGLSAGQTLLIVGGAGVVGQAASDIAAWKGAKVIVADQHRPAGSLPFVSTAEPGFAAGVRELTDDGEVDVVLDMVGGPLLGPAMSTLRDGGQHVLMASPAGPEATLDAAAFYRRRLRMTGVNMTAVDGAAIRDILEELTPGFEAGSLTAPSTRGWPLAEAVGAYEAVAAGTGGIKQVLYPGDAQLIDHPVGHTPKGTS
jgi:NADPH:quinone reductase-like Zn-dependent oxidoreductase